MEAVLLVAALGLIGWAAMRGPSPWDPPPSAAPADRGDTKGGAPAPLDPGIKVPEAPAGTVDALKQKVEDMLSRFTQTPQASDLPVGAEPGITNPQQSPTDFTRQANIAQAQLVNRNPTPQPAGGELGYLEGFLPTQEILPFGVDGDRLSVVDDFAVDAATALQKDPNVHVGLSGNLDPLEGF